VLLLLLEIYFFFALVQVTEISRKGWANVTSARSDYDEPPRVSGERSSLLSGSTSGGYAPLSGGW
jgi:hypothetical protein